MGDDGALFPISVSSHNVAFSSPAVNGRFWHDLELFSTKNRHILLFCMILQQIRKNCRNQTNFGNSVGTGAKSGMSVGLGTDPGNLMVVFCFSETVQ